MAVTTRDLKEWGITKTLDDMMCDELFGPEKTMTDDLVKRLHQWGDFGYGHEASKTMHEAADRIEKLEAAYAQQQQIWSDAIARADRYEKALSRIYAWYPISVAQPRQTINDIREFARAALKEKKDG